MTEQTFTWRNFTFVVRLSDGKPVYRDQAHLGGPWSDAEKSIANKSLDVKFRRLLKKAVEDLKGEKDEKRHQRLRKQIEEMRQQIAKRETENVADRETIEELMEELGHHEPEAP